MFMFWLCARQLCSACAIARRVNNKTAELPTLIDTVIYGQTLYPIKLVLVIDSRNHNSDKMFGYGMKTKSLVSRKIAVGTRKAKNLTCR